MYNVIKLKNSNLQINEQTFIVGARGGAVGWGTALQRKVTASILDWNFLFTYIFQSHYDLRVSSASNRNEY